MRYINTRLLLLLLLLHSLYKISLPLVTTQIWLLSLWASVGALQKLAPLTPSNRLRSVDLAPSQHSLMRMNYVPKHSRDQAGCMNMYDMWGQRGADLVTNKFTN